MRKKYIKMLLAAMEVFSCSIGNYIISYTAPSFCFAKRSRGASHRRRRFSCLIFVCIIFSAVFVSAQEEENVDLENPVEEAISVDAAEGASGEGVPKIKEASNPPQKGTGAEEIVKISSNEFVKRAWEVKNKKDLDAMDAIVKECLEMYGGAAKQFEMQLTNFPERGKEKKYSALNDVATCLFVRGEVLMSMGRTKDAMAQFQDIIDNYKWAQAWDPRGWYWSIAEKSQASINVLTGEVEDESENAIKKVLRTKPMIHFKGKKDIIDYTKYGKFEKVGTVDYKYIITDKKGLADALGEGIYPNVAAVYNNGKYKHLRKEGRLKGSHWDFTNSDDLEAAYFKWATSPEPWGVKLFYIGMIFEKAGMYYEALKAYHAVVVHFPKTVAWTYWQTPWYPGQAAIAKIRHIIRQNPEMGLMSKWMKIKIKNGYDNDVKNDVITVYPGKIVKKTILDKLKDMFNIGKEVPLGEVKKVIGKGEARLVQYQNGHWQLLVKNKPYVIKGITYDPTKIGESPDKGTLANWMGQDTNNNGKPDGPYDSWVDINRNNKKDPGENVVGDFQLMKEMGVNTIRIYHVPTTPDKKVLNDLFKRYGIRVIMGDFLGKYTIGSDATWFDGTDYENPQHRRNMLENVKKMVMEHKDEPYILMWLLGNENNYGVASNADKKPEAYFKFVDEVAKWIKSVDKNHPVAASNGDTLYLDIFSKNCPNVDIFTANVYRGNYGFGSFWEQVSDACGKPTYITEYGCPAFARHLTLEEAEVAQVEYLRGNWMDIEANLAGHADGIGNSLGGVVFEWIDEWWKNYEPYLHDRKSDAIGPFPGGYYFEEWFGVVSQGNGSQSPFLRQLRKSYFLYKEFWN